MVVESPAVILMVTPLIPLSNSGGSTKQGAWHDLLGAVGLWPHGWDSVGPGMTLILSTSGEAPNRVRAVISQGMRSNSTAQLGSDWPGHGFDYAVEFSKITNPA